MTTLNTRMSDLAASPDDAQFLMELASLRQAYRCSPFSGWNRWLNVFSHLAPDMQLGSVLDLSLDQVRDLHLQGLLLDVDCTLKDYHAGEIPAEVLDWIRILSDGGIRLCLLSNGRPERIGRLAEHLNVSFVAKAFKPLPFGCRRGLQRLGLPRHRIAVIGDQLFADVLAGRLAGLFTILVRPTSPAEPWFTRLKRPMERYYLRWWNTVSKEQKVKGSLLHDSRQGGNLLPSLDFSDE